jgi:hypothetical protein
VILAKVGPAFQPPLASAEDILAGLVIVALTVVVFAGALGAAHWYADRP